MCGIIGKIGTDEVMPKLINGLKKLEYRGYDSSGIGVFNDGEIKIFKATGNINELEKVLENTSVNGTVGIGHTRWATHGKPSEKNAHPHISPKGIFAVVHNGIIENSDKIKKDELNGNIFYSETDTEVIAHMLEKYYKGDPVSAISRACKKLCGSYALGILCRDFPEKVFATANGSPLMVVKTNDGAVIASDLCAISDKAKDVYKLSHGEICILEKTDMVFFDSTGKRISKKSEGLSVDNADIEKDGYEHFMLKEIMQQPNAVEKTIDACVSGNAIVFPCVYEHESFFRKRLKEIVFVACGSAYYAGLVGKNVVEGLCRIPCRVEIASEFRYSEPFVDEHTLAVFISQSGEPADTLAALCLAKKSGAKVLSVVNVKGSTMAQESDNVIYTAAGKEIAVATTKAYSAQLVALYCLGIYIASLRGTITAEKHEEMMWELRSLPRKIADTIEATTPVVKELARKMYDKKDVLYIGRQSDYATAAEGSLKMKEISYINSQAYAAGELKHGTISLIDNGFPVVAVAGQERVFSKTLSNIAEVDARCADVIVITHESFKEKIPTGYTIITVGNTLEEFKSSLSVLPLQLLSYYTAKLRGCDIDKPKNLAKSVTVE